MSETNTKSVPRPTSWKQDRATGLIGGTACLAAAILASPSVFILFLPLSLAFFVLAWKAHKQVKAP